MTGCAIANRQDLLKQVDETVTRLVPEVAGLLEGLSAAGDLRHERENGTRVLAISVRFPDGVGRGAVVARIFRYRDVARVDVELVHNRVLADAAGAPTPRVCFLNDFVASAALPAGAEGLPDEFRRTVTTGVRTALDAVERHNRLHPQPWSRVRVVTA
jgi:hypothetical protein